MPRYSLKPDASFFKKIAIGAVGTRAICAELATHGHHMEELERGSTDTKLWKEVKRKRVRIPDLVCKKCGLRVESRAKTEPDLSMSHSPTEAARAWDYGMVDSDCVAFPVCLPVEDRDWTSGRLGADTSYWHEQNWVRWKIRGAINYFPVSAFRAAPHSRSTQKGVTEGSETAISWDAAFSSQAGTVEAVVGQQIKIKRAQEGHMRTRTVKTGLPVLVDVGDSVHVNQVVASAVTPYSPVSLACSKAMPDGHLAHLMTSRELTQRFTGVKLARLRCDREHENAVTVLVADAEEDVYVRLEGASYLASVCERSARKVFRPFLESHDEQVQLEAVIALGEAATPEAVTVLCAILDSATHPYFLRSAAAWSLGRVGTPEAAKRLVHAFADVELRLRQEALDGIVSIGGAAVPILLAGLRDTKTGADIAAGCAEALRQQPLDEAALNGLVDALHDAHPSHWTVWLAGNLPREHVSAAIVDLQEKAPPLHYAISLLWSFMESWIARHWDAVPQPLFPKEGGVHDLG